MRNCVRVFPHRLSPHCAAAARRHEVRTHQLGWPPSSPTSPCRCCLRWPQIRMAVYAMRRLFAAQDWLKTGERAIAFSIAAASAMATAGWNQ